MMKLYHGSHDANLDRIKTQKEMDTSFVLFDGLFFGSDLADAESHGEHVYIANIDEDDIYNSRRIEYSNEAFNFVKNMGASDDEASEILAIIADSISVVNEENTIPLERIAEIIKSESGYEYVLWGCQNTAGQIAQHLGYKAIALADEHGTSYLVLPGGEINKL